MSLVRNAVAAAIALCAVAPGAAAQTSQRTAPAAPSAAAPPAAADTLHYQVRAGAPFLVVLPATAGGRPATYRAVSAPAMSWLVDRSFYWKTLPTERGTMPIVFEQTAASDERLVLMVEIVD